MTPPAYTGKPPIILPGIHPGETTAPPRRLAVRSRCRSNSTLIVRSTGKLNLDVTGSAAASRRRRKTCMRRPAPKSIASRSRRPARRRCAAPARSDLAVQRHSRQAADHRAHQGSRAAEPRLAAVVLPARRRLRGDRGASDVSRARTAPTPHGAERRIRCSGRPISRWSCRRRAPGTASARPSRISPIIPGPAPT